MKIFTICFLIALGHMSIMQPAWADVVGRITGDITSTGEITIDGVRYKLLIGANQNKSDAQMKRHGLSTGQVVQFKSDGTTITQIKPVNQQVDMLPLPRFSR